jgi:hypothetical protein
MGEKLLNENAIIGLVRGELRTRTMRELALAIGVTEGFLSMVVRKRKAVGRAIPKYFGLRPVTLYEWRRPTKPSPRQIDPKG